MKKVNRILVIIRRYNGDVLLSSPLIDALYKHYEAPQIDLLVNDDTLGIAKTIRYIHQVYTYSYKWRELPLFSRIKNEFDLFRTLYRKYDLSINLTANDRSILYAATASPYAVSAREAEHKKSWWKKIFLKHSYTFKNDRHILLNNLAPLKPLGIELSHIELRTNYTQEAKEKIAAQLKEKGIDKFIIYHPSAQHEYKVYPEELRNRLLKLLNQLKIPVIITGANSPLEVQIKNSLPELEYIYDFMGDTSLDEYIALSDLSLAYIGMDTLNMHIASGQNKRIFAIFGPTLPQIWSPWSNQSQSYAAESKPVQTYGNVTLFQADMPCVACGLAGCDDKGGRSDCLYQIDPHVIFREVSEWIRKSV
ncbi:lipopolysaccharide heptosyltransferase [Sulfurovum lithotrophicum]|uniref:Lipopolysaccharide heptosyltransferase n=1 Tax=Sulfurovum lithotrophicum TaxID=206403 RepID=A0A7U4RQ06_9BACT|nr:glycosyltransferase family 9 protein [Sulfurovum lithotrophicum]AKF24345.1 lipopolysaccharide heptosyltransferase [Sulfurovum lithotrophicum]